MFEPKPHMIVIVVQSSKKRLLTGLSLYSRSFERSDNAAASTLYADVLPPSGSPTSMKP